ncbi:MAG: hypothetical protein SVY10_02455 [Thermodesulfobacteriota bacterium]|nr:hypothetical protein [Thermodesulfobacteriota bacterium]
MNYNDDVTITMELDERFDELFGENEIQTDSQEQDSSLGVQDSPIKDLKVAVLSLDWEITDQIMDRFNNEIDRQKEIWKHDKTILMFLQLLGGVGQYIRKKRDKAHHGSIGLLHSAYSSLEKVALTNGISEENKQRLFRIELNKFNELKRQIALEKTETPRKMELPLVEAMEIETPPETVIVAEMEEDNATDIPDSPVKNLKEIVESLDLEIKDQVLVRFNDEMNRLKHMWNEDRIALLFLQLIGGIGKYIQVKKEKANPKSMRLLCSACDSLEKVMVSQEISELEKDEIFIAELNAFNEFKKEIALEKTAVSERMEKRSDEMTMPQVPENEVTTEEDEVLPTMESHVLFNDEMPDQEDMIETQNEFIEEKFTLQDIPSQDTPAETEIVAIEEEINIGKTLDEEEYAPPEILISDTISEEDFTGEEKEINISDEVTEEPEFGPTIISADTFTEDSATNEEEISSKKKKGRRRFWLFGKRKKDTSVGIDEEIEQKLEIKDEEEELEFREVDKEGYITPEMTAQDIVVQDDVINEEEISIEDGIDKEEYIMPEMTTQDITVQDDMTDEEEIHVKEKTNEEAYSSFGMTTQNKSMMDETEQENTLQELTVQEADSTLETKMFQGFPQDKMATEDEEIDVSELAVLEQDDALQMPIEDACLLDYAEDQGGGMDFPELTYQDDQITEEIVDFDASAEDYGAIGVEDTDTPCETIEEEDIIPEMIAPAISGEYEENREEMVDFYQQSEDGLSRPEGTMTWTDEAFIHVLEEIKNTIQSEFSSLREELKLWREEK